MKLTEVNFSLDWPPSIDVKNLRKYVVTNLLKKGEIVRWSIINIQTYNDPEFKKEIYIHAVLANTKEIYNDTF